MQTNQQTMTQKIYQETAPFDNPYQGNRSRLLFVCSAGLLRSPTGAAVGSIRGYNTRSCGTEEYALVPLSVNLINWANWIIFVNKENYNRAVLEFGFVGYDQDIKDKAITLDIPDIYEAFHPTLIRIWNDWFDEFERKN